MAQTMFDLTGRLALVTGSSRGIGYAVAEGLAAAGAGIVVNSRNPDDVEAARARLSAGGAKTYGRSFDVTDRHAVEAAVAAIENDVGPIDILCNNAGIQRRAPLVDFAADTWREIMAANLDSVFYVSQSVARRMIPRGRGKIINICSLGSERARETIAPYTASKGAVKMLTKSMCVEWAKFGIQANGIGPGYFKTELNLPLQSNPQFDAWVRERTPAGRWGDVDELKGVAVFLASPASDFVNGQVIYVDGGFLSRM